MPMVSSAGSLVGILSMVTGLLVSFRATSSYERYVGQRLLGGAGAVRVHPTELRPETDERFWCTGG